PDAPQGEVHAQSDGACCPGCVVTPEPASAVLLAAGMIPGVGGGWRRRRRGLDVREGWEPAEAVQRGSERAAARGSGAGGGGAGGRAAARGTRRRAGSARGGS